VPGGARVAVVTRSQVHARLVYVAAQQTLLLLTDPAIGFGVGMPEAKGFRRWQALSSWPLEPRWEGSATIDEYMPAGRAPLRIEIHTDRGTILIANANDSAMTLNPPPIAVVRITSSSGRASRAS
jgi:hypothetical protein